MSQKFHIKKNDLVVVIAGAHKGKSGKVLEIRLIMATPSTTARFLAERISRILPDLPLWAPAMTTTTSFFLM